MSTSNRYGMMGAICAMVTFQTSVSSDCACVRAGGPKMLASDPFIDNREGLHKAYQQRRHERAGQGAKPADHDDDKEDWAEQSGHVGLVTSAGRR